MVPERRAGCTESDALSTDTTSFAGAACALFLRRALPPADCLAELSEGCVAEVAEVRLDQPTPVHL